MGDITATVLPNSNINASIDIPSIPTVPSVGIRGPRGLKGDTGTSTISGASDVDVSDVMNGSVLVFKTITNKWTATTTLEAQTMEGGFF